MHGTASPPEFVYLFPFFFIGLWLTICISLSAIAGWPTLVRLYPDRPETPLRYWGWQSGSMRGVHMNGILKIGACPGGLRVGIWRIFGPFSRDFFVPWADIKIEKTQRFFIDTARLTFGNGMGMTLYGASGRELPNIAARMANGQVSADTIRSALTTSRPDVLGSVLRQWIIRTGLASAFFTIAPRLLGAQGSPPAEVAFAFPATLFGIIAIFSYLYQSRRP